jgi:hypothetical protein
MSKITPLSFKYNNVDAVIDVIVFDDEEQKSLLSELSSDIAKTDELSLENFEIFVMQKTVVNTTNILELLGVSPNIYRDIGCIRTELIKQICKLNTLLDPINIFVTAKGGKMAIKPSKTTNSVRLAELLVYGSEYGYKTVVVPEVDLIVTVKIATLADILEKVTPAFMMCKVSKDLYKSVTSIVLINNFATVIPRICMHKACINSGMEEIADLLYKTIIRVNPHLRFEDIDWDNIGKSLEIKGGGIKGEDVDSDGPFASNYNPFKNLPGTGKKNYNPNVDRTKLRNHYNTKESGKEGKARSVNKFSFSDIEKTVVKNLPTSLREFIYGQDEAIDEVCKAIKRASAGIRSPERPIGSFIFAGQTGVGKTYCARTLAKVLHSNMGFLKINCSELSLVHEAIKLIGAPPSYVGYDSGGMLTNYVEAHPTSVILFDEFEKAHERVQELVLQVLEDGELCDGKGQKVSFKNCIITFTTNLGAKEIKESRAEIGFGNKNCSVEKQKNLVIYSIEKKFKPEFINRLDKIIFFEPLAEESYRQIIKFYLDELASRVSTNNRHKVVFSDDLVDYIYANSIDDKYGARPVRRFIEQNVANKLADRLINIDAVNIVWSISVTNNEIVVEEAKHVRQIKNSMDSW